MMAQAGATLTALGITPRKNPDAPSRAMIFFNIRPTRASIYIYIFVNSLLKKDAFGSLPSASELT